MNGNGQGLLTKMFAWIQHPQHADRPPVDYLAFLIIAILAGLMWSKTIRQTLEAV